MRPLPHLQVLVWRAGILVASSELFSADLISKALVPHLVHSKCSINDSESVYFVQSSPIWVQAALTSTELTE